MDFGLSEDQVLFKSTLRRFLDAECPTPRVREIMESDGGHDPRLWAQLVELGLSGLVVPAELGGSEQDLLDLALAAEELGFACTPGPFLGNAVATVALKESGDVARDLLQGIAAGDTLATIALGEDESEWSPSAYKTRVEAGKLTGVKPLVPYAADADVIVVGARDAEGAGLWMIEKQAPGMSSSPIDGVDRTRRVHTVRFDGTPARRLAGAEALARTIDAGCVLIAADAYGGARRCLDMTLAYALQRQQFGQILAAFQAVKHQLANLTTDLEPALSLWWYAAHAFDHIRDQSSRHAALAKAHLTDLYDRVTRECTELHGGIGFTWEYDLHLWFRRAVFDRGFFGDAAFHRARAAALAGW